MAILIAAGAAAGEERPISVHDLVNIRDIGGSDLLVVQAFGALSVSPDGGYIAFQMQTPNFKTRSYDLSWRVIETVPKGKTWSVSNGGEVILDRNGAPAPIGGRYPVKAEWSPDSEWIYYLKRISGDTQIWRSRIDHHGDEQVTQNAGDILSMRLSTDGEKIFFTAANPKVNVSREWQEEGDRGFLYDGRFHPQRSKMPYQRACGSNPSGSVRYVGMSRPCEPPLRVFDITAQIEREATAEEVETYRRQITTPWYELRPDERVVKANEDGNAIWLENEDPEKFPGYRPPMRLLASLNDSEFRCSAKECYGYSNTIGGASWLPGRNEVVFQRADGQSPSMSGIYSWTPGTDKVRTIIQTEDLLADCKVLTSHRAICLRERWTRPTTIVSVNLDSGEIETIYDPNPEFDDIQFSEIEKIEWTDMFGNPTHGHLVYPLDYKPGRRYPLVITTYRSVGFLRGATGDEYPTHVLAANGFMVLSYSMPSAWRRGAVMGLDFHQFQLKDKYERRSTLSSQEKILDMLTERGLVDPDRVAITGLSNGAVQVMYALANTNRFNAGIASSIFDWHASYYQRPREERALRRQAMGGTPEDDEYGLYKAYSLGQNAEQVEAPLLVHVSDHELMGSVEAFARLQDAGKPVEMYVFPDEYHLKWQPQHRLAIYRRNVQWLKFWLMDEEEDNPVSPSQYDRWREMRDERCAWDEPNGDRPAYCPDPIN